MTAIVAADIVFRRSVLTGSAGNSVAQLDPNASLGKYMSTTAWAGGNLNDLYDDVSGAENAANTVDYRCIFVYNANAANILQNAVVYISAETAGGTSVALAADTTAASSITSSSAQALTATNETTGPQTSLTYASPTTIAAGVVLGNIGVGQCKAFWIRRTAASSAALSNDGGTISVTGDTGSL